MYLAKNNSLLKKNNVAYVSMVTKYPIIKILFVQIMKISVINYDHTLMATH